MGDKQFEAFKRAYLQGNAAMRRGDLEEAWGGVPEDFELHPPADFPDRGVRRGRKEILAFIGELWQQIPGWIGRPVEFINAGGGTYVVRLEMEGTSRYASIPAKADLYQVWEVPDGVPVREREFFDRDHALRAAGLEGEPPQDN